MFGFHTIQRTLEAAARAAGNIPPWEEKFKIRERLLGPFPEGPSLWMHGASLGECKMLLSLAQILKADIPSLPKIILTTQKAEVLDFLRPQAAASGFSMAMAPLDAPRALGLFLEQAQPQMLVLAENELWPGYLEAFHKNFRQPRVALVSGRFYRCFSAKDFEAIGFASMQTGADLNRFAAAGDYLVPEKTIVGGDWKLLSWARSGEKVHAPENPTVDAAFLSFHFAERRPLLKMLQMALERGEAALLAPRFETETAKFEELLSKNGLPTVEWPKVQKGCVSLVRGYGKLGEVLQTARAAVVGGSFSKTLGIHDFWEPLKRGVETRIGPYFRGQGAVVSSLLRDGAIVQIQNPSEYGKVQSATADAARRFLLYEREKILASYKAFVNFVRDTWKPETL